MSKNKTEKRNDPTAADGDVMDALQQIDADVDKAIAAQKTDPDRKTDPDDIPVNDALKTLKQDIQAAILAQSKDGAADARARALVREVRASTNVTVRSEPRVYTQDGPNSYFRDLAHRNLNLGNEKLRVEAVERLNRHAAEVFVDYRSGNEYVIRSLGEIRRGESAETRAVSTDGASDGVFVTPQYLIDQWITFRSPDRTFTNQCDVLPLPTYGVQFNIPAFTAPGAAAQQTSENTGIANTVPTSDDVTVQLDTFSGYVPVSQQLVDRGGFEGQGGSFDVIVIKQSQDQLYAAIDTYLINQALAGAQSVINNGTTATIKQFYADFATARNLLADTAGVKLPGTHMFSASDFWGWASSQVDNNLRPIIVPDPAALVAVNTDPKWSGWTGVYMPGNYRWFSDDNTTTAVAPSTEYTILVGSPSEMLFWLGDMIPFTAIQTYAGQLSVLCGLRQYAAGVARHAEAFAYITGTAYPTTLV